MDLGAKKKSFKCNECEQEFQRSNDLKNHLKRDHKKPKELPKLHPGRTTHYNCPECNKPLPSAREVKLHLDKEHKKTQAFLGGNEDLDLSVTRKKPTASKPTANNSKELARTKEDCHLQSGRKALLASYGCQRGWNNNHSKSLQQKKLHKNCA